MRNDISAMPVIRSSPYSTCIRHVSLIRNAYLSWMLLTEVVCDTAQELEDGDWGGGIFVNDRVLRQNEAFGSKRSRAGDILDIILRMPDVMDSGRR